MEIIPAIDIIDGKCVRLSQGDYNTKKEYSANPVEIAQKYEEVGLKHIHIVDLEGAKNSQPVNLDILQKIASQTDLFIDYGGGIKTEEDLQNVFDSGADQITAGSVAVKQKSRVEKWLQKYGSEKIILGADIKEGKIIIVVDDEDRENEGDFVVAGEKISPEKVNFMAKYGRGLICAPLPEDRCEELDLEFDVIAPSHGIIWRGNIPEILERYDAWSSNDDEDKVIILYDSMWHHTEEAAFTIAKGVEENDVDYRVYNLSDSDWTEIMAEVMLSKGLIVGSPTLNGEIYPAVAGFLTYMKGLSPVDKITAAFGSYGWSGEAVGKITDIFEDLDYEIVDTHKWIFDADQEELSSLKTLGEKVSNEVIDSN